MPISNNQYHHAFSFIQGLRTYLHVQPRATIAHHLANPVESLKCTCCEDGRLSSSYQDACTLYALYGDQANRVFSLESLEATYHNVAAAGSEDEEEEEGQEGKRGGVETEMDKRLRVRFARGVGDLERTGFLRFYRNGEKMIKMIYEYITGE